MDPPERSDPNATVELDMSDPDIAAVANPTSRRTGPPPLPPEELARASMPDAAPRPSTMSAPPPPKRSTYGVLLVVFLVVGLAGGAAVALTMRGKPTAAAPDAQPAPATSATVIVVPTIDMNDDVDGGS